MQGLSYFIHNKNADTYVKLHKQYTLFIALGKLSGQYMRSEDTYLDSFSSFRQ